MGTRNDSIALFAEWSALQAVYQVGEVAGMACGHINGRAGLEGTMLGPARRWRLGRASGGPRLRLRRQAEPKLNWDQAPGTKRMAQVARQKLRMDLAPSEGCCVRRSAARFSYNAPLASTLMVGHML